MISTVKFNKLIETLVIFDLLRFMWAHADLEGSVRVDLFPGIPAVHVELEFHILG